MQLEGDLKRVLYLLNRNIIVIWCVMARKSLAPMWCVISLQKHRDVI